MGKAERKKAKTARRADKAERRAARIAEMQERVRNIEQQIADAEENRQPHGLPRLRLQLLFLKLKLSTRKWRVKAHK
jgi:hypothetical protein